jgi:glycosyltransferase involved in cell wall biosynthesis
LRTYQYLPFFRKEGWNVTISPLFNDQYLSELYSGKGTSWPNVISCYFTRFILLFTLSQYERIVIEKELFPFLPSWAEWGMSRIGQGYIVDYDDAVFHNYDLHPSFLVRYMLKNKIDKVMRYSQTVMVGNSYLEEKAKRAEASSIFLLPTVVDGARYFPLRFPTPDPLVKIGWIGSPTTLKYLEGLLPVLERLKERHAFELVIIGGGASIGFSGKETLIPWSEENEVRELQKLDIGVMPLTHTSWEKGKCGYKLIQYMACGIPVAGSPVGINKDLIIEGENGFLPLNDKEWVRCLGQLITNRELRIQLGKKGYRMVGKQYTLKQTIPVYLSALGK